MTSTVPRSTVAKTVALTLMQSDCYGQGCQPGAAVSSGQDFRAYVLSPVQIPISEKPTGSPDNQMQAFQHDKRGCLSHACLRSPVLRHTLHFFQEPGKERIHPKNGLRRATWHQQAFELHLMHRGRPLATLPSFSSHTSKPRCHQASSAARSAEPGEPVHGRQGPPCWKRCSQFSRRPVPDLH